ncbi:immune inhibitor A peptidase M6-domain-containing protein [Boeremia exigua]|uniref:immune inhibitor A peptidase M6-domain-containing protein n=1 Tax=Boeremia exigua TaxID=749465 RepID=UPI001E8CCBF1|nr:immune inhibitor A peptidase M6-domain-containing protein [Boeremia exigua]KAH6642487.1 immune inhibitor A peptidase M6-domain-containing protein [Boeremia exigua]
MSHAHHEARCFVPPHPSLLARTKRLQLQNPNDAATLARVQTALPRQSSLLGRDDGAIFPKSHFSPQASIKTMAAAALERAPLRNAIRIIVVVVEFQDVKCPPETIDRTKDLWFSTNKIPTGSVTDFYSEVSNNAVSLTGEVVGPFTLREKMSHYANDQSGMGWPGPNSQTMADEAFLAAKDQVDFKPYDNDGNGYVDAFVVVHAGRAAEETGLGSDIWSVKWVLPEEREANGVKVFGFLTVPADAKCGVCAHEIGHLVFGWPDLYDTDSSSAGIGNWCLMGSGSWGGGGDRPVHPSAWCKSNQGWVETVVETSNRQITLRDVKDGYKIHRLWTNGDTDSKEYFLVENRQTVNSDEFLPGKGLLIWHIDDRIGSNTDENHPWIKLMQADGLDQLKQNFGRGDDGDAYPGFTDNRKFDRLSNPNSKSYQGTDTLISVTNIPISQPIMTFDITVTKSDQPQVDKFNPRMWYRLKNTYQPSTHCLDTINDNDVNSKGLLQMAVAGSFSGQYWQLKANEDGSYFLRTLFLGPDRQLGVKDDRITPILQTANPSAVSQYWTIEAWDGPEDGTWHLENAWTEQSRYLDTMEGGPRVEMNQANDGRPTQRWTIEPIREITEPGF